MEVEFLFAGYGLAVSGCGVEGPLLDGRDNRLVDAVAKAAGYFDVGDFPAVSMTMSRMTSPFVPRGSTERSGLGVGK